MTPLETAGIALGTGALAAAAATPLAIRLAHRLRFYDRPAGYKQHGRPTPYLGGLAVVLGFLLAIVATGSMRGSHLPIVLGAAAVWALGTLDDRVNLHPFLRVAAEGLLGWWLWSAGVGWHLVASDALNLGMTIAWVVVIVNGFNLMDNMDGSGSTTGAIAAAGIGGFAVLGHSAPLAAIAFALAGALLGFLPANLARPARIFLGDGGSMVIGFVVAGTAMTALPTTELGFGAVLCASLLAGLPLLDTTMVVISRRRRGEPVLAGARDHLTHRLLRLVGSTRYVCSTLACGGMALAGTALLAGQASKQAVLWAAAAWAVVGICVIAWLEFVDIRQPRSVGAIAELRDGA